MASRIVMEAPVCQTASSLIQGMVSSPVSVQVKDVSKRKRVNRNAKLKQCKQDARREQWLAQVTGKHGKMENHDQAHPISVVESQNLNDPGELVNPADHGSSTCRENLEKSEGVPIPSHLVIERQDHHHTEEENSGKENLEVRSCMSECSEVGSSPKSCGSQSPKSKITRWAKEEDIGRLGSEFVEESCNKEDKLHSRNSHNINNAKPVSDNGQMPGTKLNLYSYMDSSFKDEGEGIESVDDDWEAAADALGLNSVKVHSDEETRIGTLNIQNATETTEFTGYTSLNRRPPPSRTLSQPRAWRPDDSCRPSCLPSLAKQNSFPSQTSWKHLHFSARGDDKSSREVVNQNSVPSLCPICAEELDQTDSSFEPCSCGFQLCLFCHHRISCDDGRCPGCRKLYVGKPAASRDGII